MALNPDEVKEAMKKATEVLWSIRESFGLPVLRKPLIQFSQQLRGRQLIQPPLSPEQIEMLERENIQERVETEESPRTVRTARQPMSQPTLSRRPTDIGLPQIPLPSMIEERITQRRFLPIRGSIARVLDSYSQYISTSPKRQREDYEPYDARGSEVPHDIRLKKTRTSRASVEM